MILGGRQRRIVGPILGDIDRDTHLWCGFFGAGIGSKPEHLLVHA